MFVHTTYQSVSVTSRFENCCSGADVNWTVNVGEKQTVARQGSVEERFVSAVWRAVVHLRRKEPQEEERLILRAADTLIMIP